MAKTQGAWGEWGWRTVERDGYPDFQKLGTVCFCGPDSRDDPHFGYHLDEGWYCQHESCSKWIDDEEITHWMAFLPPPPLIREEAERRGVR